MTEPPTRLLLVEDDHGDARLVQEMIGQSSGLFEVRWSETLGNAKTLLAAETFDGVLLDLSLPDSRGIATLMAVRACAPTVAVFVLTGLDDEAVAVAALKEGAQDYLVKGKFDADSLSRIVRHGIARGQHAARQEPGEKGAPDATVIGVVGATGGCGASTIAIHLALEVRRQTTEDVLLADLDVTGNTVGFLTKVGRTWSIMDFVLNLHRLDAVLYQSFVWKHLSGVDVIQSPGSSGLGRQLQDEPVRQFLRLSRPLYSWIVVDMGRMNALTLSLVGDVDDLFLVTTTDVLGLYETKRILDRLRALGRKDHLKVIMNKTSKGVARDEGLERFVGVPIHAIGRDASHELGEAYQKGTLLSATSALRTAVGELAAGLTGTKTGTPSSAPKRSFLGWRRHPDS